MDTLHLPAPKPRMIAHRGCSGLEMENTASAFVVAGNRSYWGIETDVHVTRDGQYIVIHDDTTGRVALENLRKIPGNIEGDCTPLTLAAVEEAESEKVGVCFDMGHFQTHVLKNCPDQPELLPSEGFYKRVIHTHIHGMKGIATHYPLGKFTLPNMAGMFAPLKGRYTGIWNIELSPSRFAEYCDAETGFLTSLKTLKTFLRENGY